MTSFLRGKQAGIQRDFSAGLDPSLFAIDDVGRDHLFDLGMKMLTGVALGHTVRDQFSGQCHSIRAGTVSTGCWYQRHQIWKWSNLRLRTKASLYNLQPT